MKKLSMLVPTVSVCALFAAFALYSSPAAADAVPSGTFVLGAERLTGFYHAKSSVGPADVTVNSISLLLENAEGVHDLPRIGFDGFVIDGLSLGGSLAIGHDSYERAVNVQNVRGTVNTSATSFLFAPRVGYATLFSEHVGIWPRGGFSYFSRSDDNNAATNTLHYISINLEAAFLFKVAPNVAITAGPTLDVSLDGASKTAPKANVGTASQDASYTAFGITSGLAILF